jgi:hypothetical protein
MEPKRCIWIIMRQGLAAVSCGMIIPVMASQAVRFMTAQSAFGSIRALAFSGLSLQVLKF